MCLFSTFGLPFTMLESLSNIRINEEQFRTHFEALAKIGATGDGGVNRPAFSEAHLKARQWFLAQAKEIGLESHIDGAGNHSARLNCGPEGASTLLLGSHLDSVPYGGRFDGALGVASALEVLHMVKEGQISLNANLEAIDFTDEESSYIGLLGSRAFSGLLHEEELQKPSKNPELFKKALTRSGLTEKSILSAARDPADIAGYLELHVEQGTRLIDRNLDIGVVTNIVGIRSFKIKFIGRADHAGTTAMHRRLDAAQGASGFTLAVRELMLKKFPDYVATVGNMVFEPGAFNVVPEVVTVSLEFRADRSNKLDEIEAALLKQASGEAERFGLKLETESLEKISPSPMDGKFQKAIVQACEALDLKYASMPSMAGHDAQSLAHICPAGMFFVPSVGGFSHSSREFTEWQDCVNGANTLLQTVLILGGKGTGL